MATPQAERLESLLGVVPLAIGDLNLTEVLRGCSTDREFGEVRRLFASLDFVMLGGEDVAVEGASNFRRLRSLGVTACKTIDTVIATRCIVSGYELLHADKDFDAFEQHLGLRVVNCGT